MNLDENHDTAAATMGTSSSTAPGPAHASSVPTPESAEPRLPPADPEVGDVIDALEDALASLKAIVSNQASSATDGVRAVVRENPLAALAVTAGLVYVFTRWRR